MEPRYTTSEFKDFWSLENKYKIWLQVEYEVYKVQVELGVIPNDDLKYLESKYETLLNNIPVETILEYESIYKHDVIGFLHWLETATEGKSRFFHYGMTSSDLVDTALAIQLKTALLTIKKKASNLRKALWEKAIDNTSTIMVGRTHGMYAQPTTAGNFFAGHLSELIRSVSTLDTATNSISYGKISGPVGAYINITQEVESRALLNLGLYREPVSTQVIPRDRYLEVIFATSRLAICIERLATNIRHLHRSEVSEMKEAFAPGQKGSSSMPYKQNPIICENLCGLSRYIRGFMTPAFENVCLLHERDISHSSVERMIIPEATTYINYMLEKATELVNGLILEKETMKKRVNDNGEWHRERSMMKLIQKGMSRTEAHTLIQETHHSLDSYDEINEEYFSTIAKNSEIIVNRVK